MGFLYAIAHGANLIYDTDDDNVPLESLDNYSHDKEDIVKIKTDQNTVNIYKLFSNGSSIWPRGFPLENINNKVGFLPILSKRFSPSWEGPQILFTFEPSCQKIVSQESLESQNSKFQNWENMQS